MEANDVNIIITSKPNSNTEYTVNHYLMEFDEDHYTLDKTEHLTGTTDSAIHPDVKNYEGFTAPETEELLITGDGKAVVNYYYKRNKYQVKVEGDEGISTTSGSGTYYYGEKVSIKATLNVGYDFKEWSNSKNSLEQEYLVEATDVTLKANTTLHNYKITYLYQFDNNEKEEVNHSNPTSYTIKDKITFIDPSVTGYTFDKYLLNGEELENNTIEEGNR